MGSMAAIALLFLASLPAIIAVTFKVGDTNGWTIGVDYKTWVSGKTFRVGDTLEFKYGPSHSVSVVNKPDYDNCDGSRALQSFFDGDTKIDLTTVGTMHFLCPTPGHCLDGMKLAVPVLAAASSPTTPSPKTSPVMPPSSTPPLAPPSPGKPKTPPPSTSVTPSTSPTSSPSPSPKSSPSPSPTPSPSPSPINAASKGVMSYGMIGVMFVLMYGAMN